MTGYYPANKVYYQMTNSLGVNHEIKSYYNN